MSCGVVVDDEEGGVTVTVGEDAVTVFVFGLGDFAVVAFFGADSVAFFAGDADFFVDVTTTGLIITGLPLGFGLVGVAVVDDDTWEFFVATKIHTRLGHHHTSCNNSLLSLLLVC